MTAPAALERGPFSYDKYTLDSTTANDVASDRTFNLSTRTQIDPAINEILEVYIGGVKLKGSGGTTTTGGGDEFFVNSLTAPTTLTIVPNGTLASLTSASGDGSTVSSLAVGDLLVIKRISNRSTKNVDYAPGSVIREVDLDSSNTQIIHVAQEAIDIAVESMVLDTDDEWDAKSKEIKNLAAGTDALDGVNYTQLVATEVTTLAYKEDTEDYKLESADWAQKADGQVKVYTDNTRTGDDLGHSAKAHASVVGTHAPSTGSAKEWASEVGTNAPTEGSAKEWATTEDAIVDDSEYSAKEYAQGDHLAAGGSAKNWAQLATTPTTTATDASAKEWATGTSTHKNDGSAKDWATYTAGDVRGASAGSMSSKEWAVGVQGRGVAGEGSAKDWAIRAEDSVVDDAGYSALHWAAKAEDARIAAANSAAAVSQTYDNFSDVYLGSMADGATADTGTLTGASWGKDSSSIAFTGTTGTISVGQELTSTGSGYPVGANIIGSSVSTPLTISNPFTAAETGATLNFVGSGVYGAYDVSKDGPALNNDGDALVVGNLYFNTTDNEMRIYGGSTWIAASAAGSVSLLIYKYIATADQTTFTGNDSSGAALAYTANNINVYLNGVRLDASDYTASNGTSVVLGAGATLSDELVVVSFKSFTVANMVPASTGGTFGGAVTFSAVPVFSAGVGAITGTTVTASGLITANGGIETDTNSKIVQKGAFMQSSTHQALTLGG